MSILNTATLTSTLQSWACWLFSSISLLFHAHFSWLNFFWLEFSYSFSVIFLFDWSHFCVWDFNQIYYCKWLFCFVSCFSWEVFCLLCFSLNFVFLFEIPAKSISTSCYSISCSISEKDLLFALSNFQFRSTNFSSICIQHMRVNLTNPIDQDSISSANQLQLKL